MTSDTQIYKDRCHIFKTFLSKLMTVTECCLMFGRSRTWFYKWLHRYEQYGEDGLKDIENISYGLFDIGILPYKPYYVINF